MRMKHLTVAALTLLLFLVAKDKKIIRFAILISLSTNA